MIECVYRHPGGVICGRIEADHDATMVGPHVFAHPPIRVHVYIHDHDGEPIWGPCGLSGVCTAPNYQHGWFIPDPPKE